MLFALSSYAAGPEEEQPEPSLFHGAAGQIPERLSEELGDRILLECPVFRIEQDARGVTVTTSDGDYRADFVIVAIPPYLAGAIDYSPPLPARRIQFTQRAPMGSVIKYAALYPTRLVACERAQRSNRERPHRPGHSRQLATRRHAGDLNRLRYRALPLSA